MYADKACGAIRFRWSALSVLAGVTLLHACGGGNSNAPAPAPVLVAPSILVQPASQSIPMGLGAVFSVSASGSSLQYQWMKNGAAIAGATGANYKTPPTAFADSGASFSVTVSNTAGAMASVPAMLTVTARAPIAGDLRFRQVADSSTVYGYGNAGTGVNTDIPGRMEQFFYPALGSPFTVGNGGNCASPPITDGTGCAWFFFETPLAATAPWLLTAYAADTYANFQADLQPPSALAFSASNPISSGSVINSLDMEPASALFALGWVQSNVQTGFDLAVQTVAPADLAAAATQAGANSRVITAISSDGAQVTFISYGWQADLATVYDAQVLTSTPADAPAAAAGLAAQGYIITATGLADSAGDIFLVGTRVSGDTMPRPFLIAQSSAGNISPNRDTMMPDGYAVVGSIFNWPQGTPAVNASYTILGER